MTTLDFINCEIKQQIMASFQEPKLVFLYIHQEMADLSKEDCELSMFTEMRNRKERSRSLLMLMLMCSCFQVSLGSPQVAAMFVFGDSLSDNGNNNDLITIARANFDPYGIDFDQGLATGRFSNGKIFVDYLGNFLGLSYIPAHANPEKSVMQGVNYASAAAGILDESGRALGERINFRRQIENFASDLEQLKNELKEDQLSQHLKNSLAVLIIGSNDYLNNYLLTPLFPTSSIYSPTAYAKFLIQQYTNKILVLYGLGLRKFLLIGIGPLGCTPNQIANNFAQPGKCSSFANNLALLFNAQLKSRVDLLNANYTDAIFVYADTYDGVSDILTNSNNYGFTVTDKGCCGLGRNQGQLPCLPHEPPCINRDEHVFWDAFHPSQAVNQILAEKAYNGPLSTCYPMNVKKMAELETMH